MSDDRGSATVIGAFAMLALLTLALLVTHVGVVVAAKHRAQSVADLAALAAAGDALDGAARACERARNIARDWVIHECRLDGWDAVVTVSKSQYGWTIQATARAGPVDQGVH